MRLRRHVGAVGGDGASPAGALSWRGALTAGVQHLHRQEGARGRHRIASWSHADE